MHITTQILELNFYVVFFYFFIVIIIIIIIMSTSLCIIQCMDCAFILSQTCLFWWQCRVWIQDYAVTQPPTSNVLHWFIVVLYFSKVEQILFSSFCLWPQSNVKPCCVIFSDFDIGMYLQNTYEAGVFGEAVSEQIYCFQTRVVTSADGSVRH